MNAQEVSNVLYGLGKMAVRWSHAAPSNQSQSAFMVLHWDTQRGEREETVVGDEDGDGDGDGQDGDLNDVGFVLSMKGLRPTSPYPIPPPPLRAGKGSREGLGYAYGSGSGSGCLPESTRAALTGAIAKEAWGLNAQGTRSSS